MVSPTATCSEDTCKSIKSIIEISDSIISNNITSRGDALSVTYNGNLTTDELNALRSLRWNVDIVIKSAEKGGSIVVVDKGLYEAEALRPLYNSTTQNITKYYMNIITNYICGKVHSQVK
jgi:hypothetical protein